MTGAVFLVGAGCAAKDLITLRGLDRLRQADAVVYDDLLAEGLLAEARPDAALYDVGKRSGRHSMPQNEINALLVELSRQGKTVCRLKGGDPFVFGRGGEEALALQEAEVPFEVVPGLSSCIAVPALVGIPVTHRGLSRSFHVITAHTADTPDGLPDDFDRLAALDGTLVFLMGLGQLEQISERLIAAGKPADTPAAVVGETVVRARLSNLARSGVDFPGPAVIVVGPTAALDLRHRAALPLDGVRVGLTGTEQLRDKLRPALCALGAAVYDLQKSRMEAACSPNELSQCLAQGWDWIAFTSPNGVAVFFDLLRLGCYDLRRMANVRFAAVGDGTAAALAQRGFLCDLIPLRHDTASLGTALAKIGTGCRVLLAGAENASDAPERALGAAGISFRRHSLYRLISGTVREVPVDYRVFGSAGGVENYYRAGGALQQGACVCIGAVTAQKATALGAARIVLAAEASAQALVEAILNDYKG